MTEATMFEAKTQLSKLVRQAQCGEQIILTSGRKKTPVAMIVAVKPVTERALGMFYQSGFKIPTDFDELPEDELKAWNGECE
jgi:antitoxin (DNA-binding transcriptional repressor) of toxin-antitoxin stability system